MDKEPVAANEQREPSQEIEQSIPNPEVFAKHYLESLLKEGKSSIEFLSCYKIIPIAQRSLMLGQNQFCEELLSPFIPLAEIRLTELKGDVRKYNDLQDDINELNWLLDESKQDEKLVDLSWEKFVKNKEQWEGDSPHESTNMFNAFVLLIQTGQWLIRCEYYLYQLEQIDTNEPHEISSHSVWESNFLISLRGLWKRGVVPKELLDKYEDWYNDSQTEFRPGDPKYRGKEKRLVQERIQLHKKILPYIWNDVKDILFK